MRYFFLFLTLRFFFAYYCLYFQTNEGEKESSTSESSLESSSGYGSQTTFTVDDQQHVDGETYDFVEFACHFCTFVLPFHHISLSVCWIKTVAFQYQFQFYLNPVDLKVEPCDTTGFRTITCLLSSTCFLFLSFNVGSNMCPCCLILFVEFSKKEVKVKYWFV